MDGRPGCRDTPRTVTSNSAFQRNESFNIKATYFPGICCLSRQCLRKVGQQDIPFSLLQDFLDTLGCSYCTFQISSWTHHFKFRGPLPEKKSEACRRTLNVSFRNVTKRPFQNKFIPLPNFVASYRSECLMDGTPGYNISM